MTTLVCLFIFCYLFLSLVLVQVPRTCSGHGTLLNQFRGKLVKITFCSSSHEGLQDKENIYSVPRYRAPELDPGRRSQLEMDSKGRAGFKTCCAKVRVHVNHHKAVPEFPSGVFLVALCCSDSKHFGLTNPNEPKLLWQVFF